jgi:Icc-related predicted phosphoesterase
MKITFISDTHSKHKQITNDLPGGDLLLHAGDISSMGYFREIEEFCNWFNSLDNYDFKMFIAGNHDWGFLNREKFLIYKDVFVPEKTQEILNSYKHIDYLRDNVQEIQIGDNEPVRIYGSPWQPEFFDWAFNLPRKGFELEKRWNDIPEDIDILITHGPSFGHVDRIIGKYENLGCELLAKRIKEIKPKIHVCGHIHSGYGYEFDGDTHYINASVLNEHYTYKNKPLTIEWDKTSNKIKFL